MLEQSGNPDTSSVMGDVRDILTFLFLARISLITRFFVFILPLNPGFPSEMSSALDFFNFTGPRWRDLRFTTTGKIHKNDNLHIGISNSYGR